MSENEVNELVEHAEALIARRDYGAAIETLAKIKPSMVTPKVFQLKRRIDRRIARTVEQAEKRWQACRFDKAGRLLAKIPEACRSEEVKNRLRKCRTLHRLRTTALGLCAVSGKTNDECETESHAAKYLAELTLEGLRDDDVQLLYDQRGKYLAERRKSERITRVVKRWLSLSGFAASVVGGALGLWSFATRMESVRRDQAKIQDATNLKQWDEVLSVDPDNVDALLGRARAKLSTQPADCAGAIEDVTLAARSGGVTNETKNILGLAYAKRAIEKAGQGKSDEAANDLSVAQRLGSNAYALTAARGAIASSWLRRAEDACEQQDLAEFVLASDAAEASGVDVVKIMELWREQAVRCVNEQDFEGFAKACHEAAKRGIAAEDLAALWVMCAGAAAKASDVDVLRVALDNAMRAGAGSATLRPLRRAAALLDAKALDGRGDSEHAADLVLKTVEADPTAVATMLKSAEFSRLCGSVAGVCRSRVRAAIDAGKPQEAVRIIREAAAFAPDASEWIMQELTLDRLRSLSWEALESLPPETLAAAIESLPATAEVSLPPMINSIGIEMRLIHAGTFVMGDENGDDDEVPHRVTLSNRFYIGVSEVTNAQWKRVMGVAPSKWRHDDQPVEQVSWEKAVKFCKRLSMLSGEQAAGRVYRLPTEAEWEYVCRAGTTTRRSFGEDRSLLGDYAWCEDNSSGMTQQVRQKKPNQWGLYDMYGNVWEWCSDWYGDFGAGAVTDPQGPLSGSLRVCRGGSWASGPMRCQSANREKYEPTHRQSHLGFRVVLGMPRASMTRAEK